MKRYIRSSFSDTYSRNGYFYLLKHGIGPGTIPKDVSIVKIWDLPNSYTAVVLPRFLTSDELSFYDIPEESDIQWYLDRIGYTYDSSNFWTVYNENGDVVEPARDDSSRIDAIRKWHNIVE